MPPPPDFLTAVKREPLEKWPGKKQRWDQLATINHRGEAFPQHCVSSLASSGVVPVAVRLGGRRITQEQLLIGS